MPALQVRDFPDDLYARLKESAARNHRSIAQQTIACVEAQLNQEEQRGAIIAPDFEQGPTIPQNVREAAERAQFVELVRMYTDGGQMGLAAAVDAAIDHCIDEGYLADYLKEKRAEVSDMFLTEYDAEHQRELDRQEGREEGIDIILSQLVEEGVISPEQAEERKRAIAAENRP